MNLGKILEFCKKNRVFVLGLATSLILIGMAIYIHIALNDKIYYREGGIEFHAIVWRSYCLEAAALTIIIATVLNYFPVSFIAVAIGLIDVLLHCLGGTFDWYHSIDVWDHVTHGLSHLAITIGIVYWFQLAEDRGKLSISPTIWLSLAMLTSIGIGSLMEIREYAFSYIFDTIDQGGYDNTLQDLMFDTMGALIGGIGVVAFFASWKDESTRRFVRYVGRNGRKLWIAAGICLLLLITLLILWYGKAITLDKW